MDPRDSVKQAESQTREKKMQSKKKHDRIKSILNEAYQKLRQTAVQQKCKCKKEIGMVISNIVIYS